MKHKCEKCKDTGWIYGCYTVIVPEGYDVVDYKEPCNCRINQEEYKMWFKDDKNES